MNNTIVSKAVGATVVVFLAACGQNKTEAMLTNENGSVEVVTENTETESDGARNITENTGNTGTVEPLNDIRFGGFQEKDWLDNEYIRTLRRYMDDVHSGKERNEGLEPYKQELGGKFVVWNVEPYLAGGLLINFVFVDWPEKMLTSSVYSFVNEDTKTVTGYTVRSVIVDEETNTELTKEEILQVVAEHPELKLW
jgi:hypothetical protein